MAKEKNPDATAIDQGNHMGAKMPANNIGTHAAPLGTSHKSTFLKPGPVGAGISGRQDGSKTTDTGKNSSTSNNGRPNMPANNVTDSKVVLGHTKHAVGTVPGYLRGSNTSASNKH